MHITLDQARALDALAKQGTFQAAASALHKGHTAVVYAVGTLETQTGLTLLNRKGYRTQLTAAGKRVLEHCRHLLAAERALEAACLEMKGGWEPFLRIVFDGVFPTMPLLMAVGALGHAKIPTRIEVHAEFLAGVEARFFAEEADLMISVLPAKAPAMVSVPLLPVVASLVAHRKHPLSSKKKKHTARELAEHVLLTVRGSDPRLALPTALFDQHSTIHLNDFASKKLAIASGIGFGWLPDEMIATELARGDLVRIPWQGLSVHTFHPRLYHRSGVKLGRAAERVVASLTQAKAATKARVRTSRA